MSHATLAPAQDPAPVQDPGECTTVAERRPDGPGWLELPYPPEAALPQKAVLHASAWVNGAGVLVLSDLAVMQLPKSMGKLGPTWHVSISRKGKRPRPTDVRAVRRAFSMREAEEDNHHPGVARHLMMPVDPAFRTTCECKGDEEVVRERDGYTWTNPRPGAGPCRGCEASGLTGRVCPVHGPSGRGTAVPR